MNFELISSLRSFGIEKDKKMKTKKNKMTSSVKKLDSGKFEHSFKEENGDLVKIVTDFKIRNFETILKREDKHTHCECGKKLSTKNVKFSPNGMGKTKCLETQFCSKCDSVPPNSSRMWVTINDNFALLEI